MNDARELAHNVKHVADDVVEHARHTAESQVSDNKSRAVDGLNSFAKAIRKTGENLRADDQDTLTPYLDRAATQVDLAAGYIRNRTVGEIARDVEGFARREPALFLGGAFIAGLVGGRFLKSSTAATSPSGGWSRSDRAEPLGGNEWTPNTARSTEMGPHASPAAKPDAWTPPNRRQDFGVSTPEQSGPAGALSKSGSANREGASSKSPGGS